MKTQKRTEKLFRDAASKMATGDFEGSVNALNEVIEVNPDFDLAYRTRGTAYMKLSMPSDAVSDFKKALELQPDSPRCYHLRGLAYHQMGDTGHAVEDFDKAIQLDPDYGVAYLSRANLHETLGNDEAARRDREMIAFLGKVNMGQFAAHNNIWDGKNVPSGV